MRRKRYKTKNKARSDELNYIEFFTIQLGAMAIIWHVPIEFEKQSDVKR